LQEKVKAQDANLVAKQQDLNALRDENARLQALVDELSTSKKRLEAAKADLEKKSAEYSQLALSLQTEIEQGRVEVTELDDAPVGDAAAPRRPLRPNAASTRRPGRVLSRCAPRPLVGEGRAGSSARRRPPTLPRSTTCPAGPASPPSSWSPP
jgi:hypothetical protein